MHDVITPNVAGDRDPPGRINKRQYMESESTVLPEGYQPSNLDVLCGRGKGTWSHVGNKKYKALIKSNMSQYEKGRQKIDKSIVVASVVEQLRSQNTLFLRMDAKTGRWHDIGNNMARDKTGHAIRDQLTKQSKRKTRMPKSEAAIQALADAKPETCESMDATLSDRIQVLPRNHIQQALNLQFLSAFDTMDQQKQQKQPRQHQQLQNHHFGNSSFNNQMSFRPVASWSEDQMLIQNIIQQEVGTIDSQQHSCIDSKPIHIRPSSLSPNVSVQEQCKRISDASTLLENADIQKMLGTFEHDDDDDGTALDTFPAEQTALDSLPNAGQTALDILPIHELNDEELDDELNVVIAFPSDPDLISTAAYEWPNTSDDAEWPTIATTTKTTTTTTTVSPTAV